MIANYCISKYKSITFGVPQGSIIGTLVSLIYSNDVATALRKGKVLLQAVDSIQ